jgi:thiol:disulfide interchange protein DsbD
MSSACHLRLRHLLVLLSLVLLFPQPALRGQEFSFPDTFAPSGGGLAARREPVTVTAEFTLATAERPTLVFVTAKINEGFHIYAVDQGSLPDGGGGPMATKIELRTSDKVKLSGPWRPTTPPSVHKDEEIWIGLEMREHGEQVTWFAPVEFVAGVDPAALTISGTIAGQACNPQSCVPFEGKFQAKQGAGVKLPADAKFDASVGESVQQEPTASQPAQDTASVTPPAKMQAVDKAALKELLQSSEPVAPADATVTAAHAAAAVETQSFPYLLGLGFLGGLILNVMPCVLPVIGLKVFAFIEQAGQSRMKIFLLNFWYALGVISVFLVLAALSIMFQLGWGQLFQYAEFNIAMAAIIFAMGLSFMGVWEIPIPGFIGTSKVTDIGRKEGYEGAFAKGTITTLLATPCTGPFMGTALVGVLNRPSYQILAIFFTIGLGMASPYVLIGTFPQLVRFLPKPGEWMNTFKQFMGFVLIGTVVYLLTLLELHFVVPTVAFLFGIWMVCWWIGRVPLTASGSQRWNALGEGILIGSLVGIVAFYWLAPLLESRIERDINRVADARYEKLLSNGSGEYSVRNEPWQPYSEQKLQWLLRQGKTVLIDFTADWCPTCKFMEKTVLKTSEMERFLEENEVYTLVADWTHQDSSPEVTKKLQELRTLQIPLLAIYSPGNPGRPTLIPGTYTLAQLTEAIRSAASALDLPTKQGMANAEPVSVR